jgi:hypothetical protein
MRRVRKEGSRTAVYSLARSIDLRCEQSLQPFLHDLVARALGGRPQPILDLRHVHRVGDTRAARFHFQLARGARRAVMLAEGADRQDHRFVGRFRLNVHGMPDAVGAGERDGAGAGGPYCGNWQKRQPPDLVLVQVDLHAFKSMGCLLIDALDHYEAYLHSQQRDEAKFRELLVWLRKMLGKRT